MDIIQVIGTSTQELLAHLKITAKVAVSESPDADDKETYYVEITGEELGVLIGYHGETLNYLQQIINVIVNKKAENRVRVIVDVDGWRAQRKEALIAMATQALSRARSTGQAQILPPMSAFERRIIHAFITQETDVQTYSQGEGLSRRVVVALKSQE